MHEISVELLNQEMQRLFKEYINLLDQSSYYIAEGDYEPEEIGNKDFVEYVCEKIDFCNNLCCALEKDRKKSLNGKELIFEKYLLSNSLLSTLDFIIPILKFKSDNLSEVVEEACNRFKEIDENIESMPIGVEDFKKEIDTALNDFFIKISSIFDIVYRSYLVNFDSMLGELKEDTDSLRNFYSLVFRDEFYDAVGFDPDSVNIIFYDEENIDKIFLKIKNIFEKIFKDLGLHLFSEVTDEVSVFNKDVSCCFDNISNKLIGIGYTSDFNLYDLDGMLSEYEEIILLILSDLENIFNILKSSDIKHQTVVVRRYGIVSVLLGMSRKNSIEDTKIIKDNSAFNDFFIIDVEGLRNNFSYSVERSLRSVRETIQEESTQQVSDLISETIRVLQTDVDNLKSKRSECLDEIENGLEVMDKLVRLEKNIHYFIDDFKHLKNDINNLQDESGVAQ